MTRSSFHAQPDEGYNHEGSGEHVAGIIVDLVRRWPAVSNEEIRELEGAIGSEVRALAVRAAVIAGLADDAAQDVAQVTADRFIAVLRRGERPQNPEAYVWRMAENGTRDVHRARKRSEGGKAQLARESDDRCDETPESRWMAEESRIGARALVRTALDAAPVNYRAVIERHELDGEPIEVLAEERFDEMCSRGQVDETDADAVAHARKKARNLIDQHLKRGRDWLRKRLAENAAKEELP